MNGICKLMHIQTSQWRLLDTSFDFRDLVKEVDVNHNSDYSVIICYDPLSQLAIEVSSHMKLMHTRTDSPRFDSALKK